MRKPSKLDKPKTKGEKNPTENTEENNGVIPYNFDPFANESGQCCKYWMNGLIYKILSTDLDKISFNECEDIIRFAIGCGTLVCQGIGAIEPQPCLEDVNNLLSSQLGGIN